MYLLFKCIMCGLCNFVCGEVCSCVCNLRCVCVFVCESVCVWCLELKCVICAVLCFRDNLGPIRVTEVLNSFDNTGNVCEYTKWRQSLSFFLYWFALPLPLSFFFSVSGSLLCPLIPNWSGKQNFAQLPMLFILVKSRELLELVNGWSEHPELNV